MSAKRRTRRRRSARAGSKGTTDRSRAAAEKPRSFARRHAPELILFVVALGLRLLYLVQSADVPSFLMPLVDSEIYDRAARGLAAGDGFTEAFFYQPFFYPFFLGLVYLVADGSVVAAKVVQAILGALTCVMVAGLGARVYDRRTGLLAGALTAGYGPLIFFDGELLATGWAALWSVALVWLAVEAADRSTTRMQAAIGLASGLAVVTRPTFVPFVVAAMLWVVWTVWRRQRSELPRALAATVGPFLVVILTVAWIGLDTTGRFRFLPSSGGLNLYIGNNPSSCDTLTTRPGHQWRELVTEPERAGAEGPWEIDSYFRAKVRSFAVDQPVAFASGMIRKSLQLIGSREIPRNVDIYLFRRWSSLLWLTVWKTGPFGFPFGVLLPLAVVGVAVSWRRLPAPVSLYLVLYPLAVVAVFVSARYRAPVAPVMAVPAAAALIWLVQSVTTGATKRVALAAAIAGAVVLAAVVPGPFCQEEDLEGEYWFVVAAAQLRNNQRERAMDSLRLAVQHEPDYFEARYQLGSMLLERGDLEEAVEHLEGAVVQEPDFAFGHRELGMALGRLGRFDRALRHLQEALALAPDDPRTLNYLGALHAQNGDLDTARGYLERAVAIDPGYVAARENLRWVVEQARRAPN